MYFTPKEEKIIETALYVYAHSGPSLEYREIVKNLLNIRNKNMSEFVENPLGALSYIAEQTGLEIDFGKNEIVQWRKHPVTKVGEGVLMKVIRLFYKDGKFHYYRFYEHHNSFIDVTTSDIETIVKIIKSDLERYNEESTKPWFDSYYYTNQFKEPWWKK